MENINWICKAKTVNNNIVWMCHPKIKEHFESSPPGLLQGSTKLPSAIDITLGPANFGPTEEFCKDTTGFTKLGEWKMKFDNMPQYNGSHLNNGEFWNVRKDVGKNGDWSGDDFMPDGGAWGQWLGFSVVDANGVNTQPAFREIVLYQEFNSRWFVLIRNKSNPNSYYLMSKVKIDAFKYIANADSDTYLVFREGYGRRSNPVDKKTKYDNLNIPVEMFFSGQSGGTPIENSIYEVFIKPFVRSTYPYKAEPGSGGPPPTLASDLSSKLFLWFDANDPNGDGNNNFKDNDPVTYWKDKSKNQIKVMRAPFLQQDYFADDVKSVDGIPGGPVGGIRRGELKERLPRIKKNFKNGLSVIRLNGFNGFVPMINNDDNTKKFMAAYGNHNNPKVSNYTIVMVHYLTEYDGSSHSNLFSIGQWGRNSLALNFTNHSGVGSPTFAIQAFKVDAWESNVAVYPGSLLNKWAITTITKNDVIQTYINGTLTPPGLVYINGSERNQAPFDSSYGVIQGAYWLKIGDRDGGFAGDIGEILYFNNPLNDDERQKVEGYLAVKWNLTSSLPESNPYAIDTVNSAQLFTGANYGATSNYFSVGRYNNSQLKTIGTKTLQSLKIPSGLQVLLYQNGDFTGLAKSIIADTPDLSSVTDSRNTDFKWNNQMQSLIVQKYIPLPTSISSDMPNISLISGDSNSFLKTVKRAVLTRIDGKEYLFVDPNNKDNTFWYNASDLIATPKFFDIANINGLQLWLDAKDESTLNLSGTNVSQWKDKSDNGNNFTVAPNFQPPTFKDANSGVQFNSKQVMISAKPVTTNSNTTIFFVGNVFNNKDDFDYIVSFTQKDLSFRWNPRNGFGDNNGNDFSLDSGYIINGGTGTKDFSKRALVNFVVKSGGSGQLTLSTDKNFGGDRFFKGVMCEFIVFDTSLTPTQIQEIQGYLAWKWGLNATLPNNHPYFAKSP